MRLPSVPGPSDLLRAAGGVRDGVADALDLVPRVGAAVGRMEELLGRVSGLLDRVDAVVDRADAAIDGVARTQARADEAIERVGLTTSRADGTVAQTEEMVGRLEPLLGNYEPALTALAPSVRRLAATVDPAEVEALITLIDRLPRLVTHLDEDILPVLETLGSVGTDVHDLVDTVQDMRQIVKGFPGSRLFRRRGAEEIAEDEIRENAGA
jgi:ABC-type transporter Mla subunit MlaD